MDSQLKIVIIEAKLLPTVRTIEKVLWYLNNNYHSIDVDKIGFGIRMDSGEIVTCKFWREGFRINIGKGITFAMEPSDNGVITFSVKNIASRETNDWRWIIHKGKLRMIGDLFFNDYEDIESNMNLNILLDYHNGFDYFNVLKSFHVRCQNLFSLMREEIGDED